MELQGNIMHGARYLQSEHDADTSSYSLQEITNILATNTNLCLAYELNISFVTDITVWISNTIRQNCTCSLSCIQCNILLNDISYKHNFSEFDF